MLKSKMFLPLVLILTGLIAFAYADEQSQTTPPKAAPSQATQPQATQPQTAPPKAAPPQIVLLRWVSLSTDSRETVREIIRSEVDNREGFSTAKEENANLKAVEEEKERDDSDYKNSIISANKEFIRAKTKRDDTTTQFQSSTTELEDSAKSIKTIRSTIENLDGQIGRYDQDIKTQQDSLKRWLQTEKQGEILVAVIYTRGFKDSAHDLEGTADKASAPLIASHMGTFIQSFTKVINNFTAVDFISATEEGTAKWNNEEPLRIELEKGDRGTTYLRLKRYELYPFQTNKSGIIKAIAPSAKHKVTIVKSRKDLDAFMTQNLFVPANYEMNLIDRLIKDTNQSNSVAEEGLNEQVKSFQERIINIQEKMGSAISEKESQKMLLKRKEESYYKMSLDVASIRERKDATERQFHESQAALHEKKRTHESIIIKTTLATTKGSQTPAEASAEAILDKLSEVKNDAKTQHSSSTTEVTNFQVSAESSTQSITEARIIALRLISFINEGDSVRVKMAFRVKTILEEQAPAVEPVKLPSDQAPVAEPVKLPSDQAPVAEPVKPPSKPSVFPSFWKTKPEPKTETKSEPVVKPPKEAKTVAPTPEKVKTIAPFKRNYRPLATKDALGCLFDLRSISMTKDGLLVILEVINTDEAIRKVAFYDAKFGTWPRSRIYDASNKYYEATESYVLQGSRKTTMYEIDNRGRGIEIQPQTSVTLGLIFKNIPSNIRTPKVNLHPFIYYSSGFLPRWQEFDLPMPTNMQITDPSPAESTTKKKKK